MKYVKKSIEKTTIPNPLSKIRKFFSAVLKTYIQVYMPIGGKISQQAEGMITCLILRNHDFYESIPYYN